jgi:hypothetical protein
MSLSPLAAPSAGMPSMDINALADAGRLPLFVRFEIEAAHSSGANENCLVA